MTETISERTATPEAPPANPATAAPAADAPTPKEGRGHVAGGLPAVPFAVTTANATVALASAAALTTGPLSALVAAAGAAATTAVATHTTRAAGTLAKNRAHANQRTASAGGRTASPGRPGALSGRGMPRQGRTGAARHATTHPATDTAKTSSSPHHPSKGARRGGQPGTRLAARTGRGAVGAVRDLRRERREAAPTRHAQRIQQSAARRQLADARRAAKAQARDQRTAARGAAARTLAKPMQATRRAADAARSKARAAADRRALGKVTAARGDIRKAPARKHARQQLRRSAVRHHGRRLLAALLATPIGVLGILTTTLGRKLGLPWLMHPGRRLYRRLADKSAQARTERDEATRTELTAAEEALDHTAAQEDKTGAMAGEVPRAPKNHTAHLAQSTEGEHVSNTGFNFEEAASEMYAAATSFEPDGMMQVLASIESMPEALTSIANTFRVLAERCDSEFPLNAVIGEALNEVYSELMQAVTASEEVAKAFRTHHEGDIARHEDPRNGEEKWDTTNNQ